MTTLSTLEAYDLVKHAEQYLERLTSAQTTLSQKRALKPEKEWMAAACELVRAAREPTLGLLERARGLPELEEVRDEYAADFQGGWVDMLERLHAGFTFNCGSRDPVIEALFPHQKLAVLRRCSREVGEDFTRELDRRLKGAYVSRQLSQPAYAFVGPCLEQVNAAWAKFLSAFGASEPMPEEQASEVRKELVAVGKRLDLALLQARLLAEAALAPVNGAFEAAGLGIKPKKRKPKTAREEAAPAEQAPAEAAASEAPAEAAAPAAAEPAPGESAAPAAIPAAVPAAAAVPAEGEPKPRKRKAS